MTAAPTVSEAAVPLRYTLPALDGTIWLGLRPCALAALGVTVAAVVALLMAGAPLPLAAVVLLAGAVPAVIPIAGRTPFAWLPLLVRHAASRLLGNLGWHHTPLQDNDDGLRLCVGHECGARSVADHAGEPSPPGSPSTVGPQRPTRVPLPPECGRLYLRCLDSGEGDTTPIGVLLDRASRELTVVFEVIGTDRFGLLDPAGQDSQLTRWGTCLSALGADPRVQRVQWLTHTRPDTSSNLNERHLPCNVHDDQHDDQHDDPRGDRRVDADLNGELPSRSSGAAEVSTRDLHADYQALVAGATRAALSHEHLLTLTLTPSGTGRGGNPGRSARAAADPAAQDLTLIESVRDLAAMLLSADLLPHPLSAAELGSTIRRLCDPTLPDHTSSEHSQAAADPRRWGLLSRRRQWDSCRTDDTVHRSYAVTGWPRLALPADWLAPLLHTPPPDGTSRTMAIHAQPVTPAHAARQARAATAKARLDAADRSRLGFGPATTDTLAQTDAAALEAELVAGYRLTHLTALLTISATDPDRLTAASRAVQTLSVTHRLDLRPLHGQHPHGLVACLPLGRPLPGATR